MPGRQAGKFYLHPVDGEYALGRIPGSFTEDGGTGDNFNQHDLTLRAADYFYQARKPREDWKKLEDLDAQLAEFDLRCAAGDFDTAADVLIEIILTIFLPGDIIA